MSGTADFAVALQATNLHLAKLATSVDVGWTLLAGVLVFFMQIGFALLESGNIRSKNTISVLYKNCIDCLTGILGWWFLGFGIAFGDGDSAGSWVGTKYFVATDKDLKLESMNTIEQPRYMLWFFQYAFVAKASSIASGALSERCKLEGYALYSMYLASFVYPFVVHWGWNSDGWLAQEGFLDFAGSGIVHLVGGTAALTGAIVLGPRIGIFGTEEEQKEQKFTPSNLTNIYTGTMILWFGWYGFNAGSTVGLSSLGGEFLAEVSAKICVVCTLSAAFGGLIAFMIAAVKDRKYSLPDFCNGVLAGLVGITGACNGVDTPAACIIGAVSAFVLMASASLMKKLKIDDPIDAVSVHGACGIWGVIATGLFNSDAGLLSTEYSGDEADRSKLLMTQLLAIVVIIGWVLLTTLPLLFVLKASKLLRLSSQDELRGLDYTLVGDAEEMYRKSVFTADEWPASKEGKTNGTDVEEGKANANEAQ